MRYDEVSYFGEINTDYLRRHYKGTTLRLIDGVRCLLHIVKVNGVIAAPLSDGHGRTDGPG
jgi:hypothetical protein